MEETKEIQDTKLECTIKRIEDYRQLMRNLVYYNDYFSITLSERVGDLEEYAKKLYDKALNFEIIDKDNKNLGMISFYANDFVENIAFLTLIVVNKKNSNVGIGSNLIAFAEEYCKNKGMKKLKLEVLKNNENALKFYKKHKYYIIEENDITYYMIKELE